SSALALSNLALASRSPQRKLAVVESGSGAAGVSPRGASGDAGAAAGSPGCVGGEAGWQPAARGRARARQAWTMRMGACLEAGGPNVRLRGDERKRRLGRFAPQVARRTPQPGLLDRVIDSQHRIQVQSLVPRRM